MSDYDELRDLRHLRDENAATIARLERERVTFLDTIATLNNECNAWESALTEARADAARMRLALEALEGRWLCDCSLDGVTCENKPTCPDMIVALALDPYGHPLAPLPGGLVDSEGVFWPTCAICGKTHLTPDDGWLARHDAEVRAPLLAELNHFATTAYVQSRIEEAVEPYREALRGLAEYAHQLHDDDPSPHFAGCKHVWCGGVRALLGDTPTKEGE